MSFYKGLKVALIGTIFGFGVYFWWYRFLKNYFARWLKRDKFNNLEIMTITAIAGSFTSIASSPIWVVNTRIAT